jgi:hypothetical protein
MTEKRTKRPTAANGKGIHDTLRLVNVVWNYACPHIGARSLHHKSGDIACKSVQPKESSIVVPGPFVDQSTSA